MAKGSTTFPQPIALATTWDPEFITKIFIAGALETRARVEVIIMVGTSSVKYETVKLEVVAK
jgi:beta-glucosidase-like glycosyl hydrolase